MVIVNLALLLIKLISDLLLSKLQFRLGAIELSVAITDICNLWECVVVLIFDFLQELLVLLNSILLLLNALLFRAENLKLGTLALNLNVPLLVFLSKTGNILVASAHLLCVLIEEHGILNKTLL